MLAERNAQCQNAREKTPDDAVPATDPQSPSAEEWGRQLAAKVAAVVKAHPEVDAENVRHTLILLQLPPLERLRRSLLRGGA